MKSIARLSLVAAVLGLGVGAVAAQPLVPPTADMQITSDNVLQVDYKSNNKYKNNKYKSGNKYKNNNKYKSNNKYKNKKYKNEKWAYSSKYGKRYRSKRNGYIYFYDGYWYPRPYWRYEPGITINLGL